MGDDKEIICPYCSTLYRHDPALDPHARAARGLRPDRSGLTARARGRGVLAQRRHRRRRHRRADRGADAGAGGLPRHAAGAGRAAGGNRRRHPALAQRHAHPDRARPRRAAARRRVRAGGASRSRPRAAAASRASRSASDAERRYGAPYWVDPSRRPAGGAARGGAAPIPTSCCGSARGSRISSSTPTGSASPAAHGAVAADEHGIALIGADGLWSALRDAARPCRRREFAGRTAWRALVAGRRGRRRNSARPTSSSGSAANAHRRALSGQGRHAHQHRRHRRDDWAEPGWSADGQRDELLAHLLAVALGAPVRELLGVPERWLKWALYDLRAAAALGRTAR